MLHPTYIIIVKHILTSYNMLCVCFVKWYGSAYDVFLSRVYRLPVAVVANLWLRYI